MEPSQLPSDPEIRAACAQGEAAVIALFQRIRDQLQAMQEPPAPVGTKRRQINQGDIYWAALSGPDESEAGIPHPYVVVQEDVINHSRVTSVVVCALTSNRGRAGLPGNVLLEAGEANLPRQSVVEVSKAAAVEQSRLGEFIGALRRERVQQILAGMRFVQGFMGAGGNE